MLDVVIIGAGPGGCAAAIALARLGRSVLLVEQSRFPRNKVCGECLSSLGVRGLAQLNLLDLVKSLGAVELRRAAMFAPDGSECEMILPQAMLGISRHSLDAAMLDAARDAGARIFQPARCEDIHGGANPRVTLRDLSDNLVRTIDCRIVIAANGKGSPENSPRPSGDLGVKATFENVEGGASDAIELFGLRGKYGGLAPIEGNRRNAAFSVPASLVAKFRGDLNRMMTRIISENPILQLRLRHAIRLGDWLASPLPRFAVGRKWSGNVIPIGNAAAALEPIGGEGMGLAIESALLAAGAVDIALRQPRGLHDFAALNREFSRLWRIRRAACRLMGFMMSRPILAELTVGVISGGSGLTGRFLRAMGKSEPASEPVSGQSAARFALDNR
jgi:menaquinone-9 beta-reductase